MFNIMWLFSDIEQLNMAAFIKINIYLIVMGELMNIHIKPHIGCGFIYLLCAGDKFKIGVTEQTIKKRIRDLQTGNHEEIWCRNYIEIPRKHLYNVEKMIHLKYHIKKIKNEWYDITINEVNTFRQNVEKCVDLLKNIDNITI